MIAGHTGWEPEMIEANKSPGVILAMIIPVNIQQKSMGWVEIRDGHMPVFGDALSWQHEAPHVAMSRIK